MSNIESKCKASEMADDVKKVVVEVGDKVVVVVDISVVDKFVDEGKVERLSLYVSCWN